MALEHRSLILVALASLGLPPSVPGQATVAPVSTPDHGLKLEREYDADRDSTTVTLTLDKGRHFIRWHRPRVTAVFQHSGRVPGARPDSVLIEFRTQSPQYTSTNVLTVTTLGGDRLVVPATRSRVYHRVQTTDHTLTFALPTTALDPLLGAFEGQLEVGGVQVRLERRHFAGLADLVRRVSPEEQTFTPSNKRMHQPGRGRQIVASWHDQPRPGRLSEPRRALQVMRGR